MIFVAQKLSIASAMVAGMALLTLGSTSSTALSQTPSTQTPQVAATPEVTADTVDLDQPVDAEGDPIYLVRDGKIAHPVRGASLIGKGEQILMRIDRVGQHMTMGQGMCGSLSGSVPTNVGQPTIRVSSLTVGGK